MQCNRGWNLAGLLGVGLFCFACGVRAQHETLANLVTPVAFQEDSVVSFRNEFSNTGKLPSIKESGAVFELRFYVYGNRVISMDKVLVIQKKTATAGLNAIQYSYYNRSYKAGIAESVIKEDSLLYDKILQPIRITIGITQAVNKMIDNNLFTIADERSFIEQLEKANSLKDPCKYSIHCSKNINLVEIKSGNKFRNFFLSGTDYAMYNQDIPLFKEYKAINLAFIEIFNKAP